MDFLDPRKRRTNKIRLIIGYVLVAIAIGLGTVILVYDAYGYGINAKTGDIIQNGLLFVDSKPGGANIYLNGRSQNANTSARLILPAADYKLTLKKDGYRDWQRVFTLTEHSIARYVYPFLFPAKPAPKTLKTYPGSPGLVSVSPNRQVLLVQAAATSTASINFDQYDTNDIKQPVKPLALPDSLLVSPFKAGDSLVEIEWATDNDHLLFQHVYPGGSEFIIFDRQTPSSSVNINKLFGVSPSQVALRNKKVDQVYVFNQATGDLQVGDIGKAVLATPIIKNAVAFKSYGADLITYITQGSTPGQAAARIWDNGKTYSLSEFSAGSKYLVDAAQFQGHWYYVAGSDASDRLNIYKDPLDSLKDPALKKAVPIVALRIPGATNVSFSTNTRFIGAEAGQKFAVYDIEGQASYNYTSLAPFGGPAHWMDGHRWLNVSGGNVFVMDYDNVNQQSVVPTSLAKGGYFDQDYNQLFTTVPAAGGDSFALQVTDMRAGTDLPKQ